MKTLIIHNFVSMKKILAIMAALCAIGCTGNVDPRQGGDRDEVIRELKALGFDTERTIGVYPGSSWTIVDTEDVLGVNLNIKPKR